MALTLREERWVKERVAAIERREAFEAASEARRLRILTLKARLRDDPQYSRADYDRDVLGDPMPAEPAADHDAGGSR